MTTLVAWKGIDGKDETTSIYLA
ncbi:MAG: hypothetical protein PWP38_3022, partial [Clostridiales bacterium]|nr:hypothetical protein [Clostridiales bacterium]